LIVGFGSIFLKNGYYQYTKIWRCNLSIDIEKYYITYGPMVLRRCRHLLKDEHLAEEAMQDTFIQILKVKERLLDDSPSSLLFRVATNVSLNIIRTIKRHPVTQSEELLMAIANYDHKEERAIAKQFLSMLFSKSSEGSGTIAVLYYLDGMSHKEVAHAVSMSISGVRKRLSKLSANLKELEGYHEGR
jgi:RNA polymerase sigma-70 factor, ECF subfamily